MRAGLRAAPRYAMTFLPTNSLLLILAGYYDDDIAADFCRQARFGRR